MRISVHDLEWVNPAPRPGTVRALRRRRRIMVRLSYTRSDRSRQTIRSASAWRGRHPGSSQGVGAGDSRSPPTSARGLQRLGRVRHPDGARGHPWLDRPCPDARSAGNRSRRTRRRRSRPGSGGSGIEVESRRRSRWSCRRGRPHRRRAAAARVDRPGHRQAPHRAQPQRPGRHRFPALDQGRALAL